MKAYEPPRLTKVGTVAGLTQGDVFRQGQDHLTWIPHTRPGAPGGGPGGGHGGGHGGGFGS